LYTDFAPVLIFVIFSVAIILILLLVQRLVAPFTKGDVKDTTYECGEVPEGIAWVQFNIRFYIIALIFLIFDVEVVLLFPWAVVFKKIGLVAFVEMLIFVFILAVGLIAVWRRRDLDWVKMVIPFGRGRYARLTQAED
jgi:NADH-quinone oxidoreductase subunit A